MEEHSTLQLQQLKEKVDVITSVGDKELGGQDFDREILNLVDKKYKKLKGKGLMSKIDLFLKLQKKLKNFFQQKKKYPK